MMHIVAYTTLYKYLLVRALYQSQYKGRYTFFLTTLPQSAVIRGYTFGHISVV
jgi:hypothetical protein